KEKIAHKFRKPTYHIMSEIQPELNSTLEELSNHIKNASENLRLAADALSRASDVNRYLFKVVAFESCDNRGYYIAHRNSLGYTLKLDDSPLVADFIFKLIAGLDGRGVSFESVNYPGHFLRHQFYQIKLHKYDNTPLFQKDASYIINKQGAFFTFESVNMPGHFIRHRSNNELWADRKEDSDVYIKSSLFRQSQLF
ncbi:6786_t:CDS:2, partial [Dentiscutata erythropus]